ncbi:MAG: DNA polymerase III subunit delta [Pseudomonadota bacterium]
MRTLYPEQLAQALQQQTTLPPVLLVFGEELLLRQDVLSTIRDTLKQRFGGQALEQQRWLQDAEFDWQQLTAAGQSLSLFSQFTLLELQLTDNKPGRDGSEAFTQYCQNLPPEQLLVVVGDRLKKEQQNSRWFKTLSQHGWLIRTLSPDRARLPRFIHQRGQLYGLNLHTDAVDLLAHWFEGNLPLLDQELKKWALISQGQPLSLNVVHEYMRDVSHFDAFSLQDSLLQNDLQQASHRLQRLFEEGADLHALLWVFQREVQTLSQLQIAAQQNLDSSSVFRQQLIWSSQQQAYQQRAQAIPDTALAQARSLIEKLELALKDESGEQPQILFTHCLALLCSGPHLHNLSSRLAPMASL